MSIDACPPAGTLPGTCLRRRTQDSLTRYLAATAREPDPASQSAGTRSRRSAEYARIGSPPVRGHQTNWPEPPALDHLGDRCNKAG